MSSKVVYDHGNAVSEILVDNIKELMVRVQNNKAACIVIDGALGEGKTTLAVQCAKIANGGPLDVHHQIALGGDALRKKAIQCHRKGYKVIVYDEAGDFNSRGAISGFNKRLARFFELYRALKILIILALPRFYRLDKTILELGVMRMLLHCEERTESYGSFRAFDLQQMFYIKNKVEKLVVTVKAYDFGMVNFYGHFLDLPTKEARELESISTSNKIKEIEKDLEKEEKVEGLFSLKDLAKTINRSDRWVLFKLRENKIRPSMEDGQKKYYDKNTLQVLQGHIGA